MVFESLVADLLNKYLGDYVENLDKSQLKIGIWGGDVHLEKLDLKSSALDDLNLPVKVLKGHLGSLTVKIPWKNLYTEPVIVTIDGLYLLAVPNADIKYDGAKEEKEKQDKKQKELRRIEEAKAAVEAEKNKKNKKEKGDSFAEKFATQVVKNLQVQVTNIHVRYEDKYTNPNKPVSVGVTLQGLYFQTTDEHWKASVLKETVTMIYKLVKLDSLAVYWNCQSKSHAGLKSDEFIEVMRRSIPSSSKKQSHQFLIAPINSMAQLKINTKPEKENYTIPKVFLNLVLEEIAIQITKRQYLNVMEMLESFERMAVSDVYRKYKPNIRGIKGHVRIWWKYAYTCILEENVKRRRKMWSWPHIKYHRQLLKKYKEAYKKTLGGKKPGKDDKAVIEMCEKQLDVFSITLMRQQADVEYAKFGGKKQKKEKSGFFGGLFGGKKKGNKEEPDIEDKFYELMTPDEKSKLYDAIGYQENSADPTFPKGYEAMKLNFKLNNLKIGVQDESKSNPQIVSLYLKEVFAAVRQRPAADGITVEAKMDSLTVEGSAQNGTVPTLIKSQNLEADKMFSLVDILFEKNPLDGSCDQRVKIQARPLEIIYDALTINQLYEVLKPPDKVYLKQLTAAALSKYEEIKEQSATGLKHIIEQRKYTEVNIDVKASYVILPTGGFYKSDVPLFVLDLGNLQMKSLKNDDTLVQSKSETVDEVMDKAYDKFYIKLQNVQLLLARTGEDWQASRQRSNSKLHIMRPFNLNVNFHKSMVDDVRMPDVRLSGELPSLTLNISDKRLQDIIQLALSIPLPDISSTPLDENLNFLEDDRMLMPLAENIKTTRLLKATIIKGESTDSEDDFQDAEDSVDVAPAQKLKRKWQTNNAIDVQLSFIIKEICINLAQSSKDGEVPLLKLKIDDVGTQVVVRTFDLSVQAFLGGIYLQHLLFKAPEALLTPEQNAKALHDGPLINIINTPVTDDSAFRLLSVEYTKAKKLGPEFKTTHKNTEQTISVNFCALEVLLHQSAILSVIDFAQKLIPGDLEQQLVAKTEEISGQLKDSKTGSKKEKTKKPVVIKESDQGVIDVQVNAILEQFAVAVCTEDKLLTEIKIKGLEAAVTIDKEKTSVSTALKDIIVYDPTPKARYPKILSTAKGEDVFKLGLAIYNGATDGVNYKNMSKVDTSVELSLGCVQVVFINRYVMDLVAFMDHFQIAKDQMSKAAAVTAELAVEAAQNFHEKAMRVQLNIGMKAPVIYIPQSSSSDNALLADLGNLTLANTFETGDKVDEQGMPAVLDKMSIELSSLKLSRVILEKKEADNSVKADCLLVEPISIKLNMTRNLAFGWYKDIPEVDIGGELPNVSVGMSQGDFTMIMNFVNENLQEGIPPAKPQQKAIEKSGEFEASNDKQPSKDGLPSPVLGTPSEVFSRIKFDFKLDSLKAVLYVGDSNLTTGFSNRNDNNSLAKFEIQSIILGGSLKTDTSMCIDVTLFTCTLDDTRPGRENAITRLIERSESKPALKQAEEEQQKMIRVQFTQDTKEDKLVDCNVSTLYICVCVDYLMALADFFIKGMPETPVKYITQADGTKLIAPQGPPPSSRTKIVLAVEKPEIYLVEDAMNHNTNALILDTEVFFEMQISEDCQTMMGAIKDLQIISCKYSKEKRADTKAQILCPCEISLHMNTAYGKAPHIDITVSDIKLNISPSTIRTITAVSMNIVPQESDEESKAEVIPTDLWLVKKFKDCNLWFMKLGSDDNQNPVDTEEISEDLTDANSEKDIIPRGEQIMISVPSIIVTVEGGLGSRTVPFLILEAGLRGEVKDWSTLLYVSAFTTVEVAYYNEKLNVWEPLLEPVENNTKHRPWELTLEVMQNEDIAVDDFLEPDSPETENVYIPPAKMTIKLSSMDILEMTLTKSCLEVLTNLGKSFGDAYHLVVPTSKPGEIKSPYVMRNESGISFKVQLPETFETPAGTVDGFYSLKVGSQLPLFFKKESKTKKKTLKKQASIIRETQKGEEAKTILLVVEELNVTRQITIHKAEKRSFDIGARSYPGDSWKLIVQTDALYGCKAITFRSPVQIHNHFIVPMEIWHRVESGLQKCGEVQPDSVFSVPLGISYANEKHLFFKPTWDNYKVSHGCVVWKDMTAGKLSVLNCDSTLPGYQPFYLNVFPEVQDVFNDNTSQLTAKVYMLHLRPVVVFHNQLPHNVTYTLEGMDKEVPIRGGESVPLYNACINRTALLVSIPDYHGKDWTVRKALDSQLQENELGVWTLEAYDGPNKVTLDLAVHIVNKQGSVDLTLFSPYWMINKTGMELDYKGSGVSNGNSKTNKGSDSDSVFKHPANLKEAVMFSFKPKSFFGKKKASLKVAGSDWSDKFSLDTVGSSGKVTCKNGNATYEIGVTITLAKSGFTKIVVFTPYYMIINQSKIALSCREAIDGTDWTDVPAGECVSFWPTKQGKDMQMKACVTGSKLETSPFLISKPHTTLMKLENDIGGINIECTINEAAVVVALSEYKTGMAAVRLVNHTEQTICYSQKRKKICLKKKRKTTEHDALGFETPQDSAAEDKMGSRTSLDLDDDFDSDWEEVTEEALKQTSRTDLKSELQLEPGETILYAWDNALGKRELTWSCGEYRKGCNDLLKDGMDEFFADSDSKLYWVSFLDGMQRVLLFTQDIYLATLAQEAGELERIEQEIIVSLQGLGVSLVDNYNKTEIAYLGITSSGVIWEEKKKRFKALKVKHSEAIEQAYEKYMNELSAGKKGHPKVILDGDKMEVDVQEMMMYKPKKRIIRRSFQEGIWLQYKTSPHQEQLHAKINRIQLDNQVPSCVFQTVLAPIPPPKSVAAESVPKPFTELSLMLRKHEHSTVKQIKYFKVLVQEMTVQVDQGFLNAMISFFAAATLQDDDESQKFEEDCKHINTMLIESDASQASVHGGAKNFYEILHVSPIKVHLSFSMQGEGGKQALINSPVVNVFLQSVGVVLTDVQDVLFKLGYFERQFQFYNPGQLQGEITRHYASQAIKQMYALVLGLDVLGNPFGLIRGIGEGAKDLFYEPYQGAIQGPEEFAEGLALGMRSLLVQGVVGGAAGAVSRITGTLGKGVATLTFDDDYQRKRRERLNKRPATLQEGLARGGKGLVMGVFDGVTGIVRKPVEGAQKEGVEGFFKGLGKGLVGVVTRPTSGVIDFASSSFAGIKRVTEMSDELHRLRPPRFLKDDGIVRPYILTAAAGNGILHDTEKGRYVQTDKYIGHVIVQKDKHVLIATDQRILFVSKGEIFGAWDCDWQYQWTELREPPKLTDRGIEIYLQEKQKKGFGSLFKSNTGGKLIPTHDRKTAEQLILDMTDAMRLRLGK